MCGKSMTKHCEAQTRKGTPCQRPAGWGTDHVGEGRCKLHAGNAGRPIKHGRYSVKYRKSLAEKAERFLNEPDPYDLTSELSLMRALLQDYLDRFWEGELLKGEHISYLFDMLEQVSKQVERMVKLMNETALTQAELEYIKVRMADELPNYIPNVDDQIALVRAIFGTFSDGARHRKSVTRTASRKY